MTTHHKRTLKTRLDAARRYFFRLLHTPDLDTRAEHWVRVGIASLIALSMLTVVLESEPEIEREHAVALFRFEAFVITAFALEYIIRVWAIIEDPEAKHRGPILGRVRYALTPLALIDLLSVLPFLLPALFAFDLSFIRMLRLIRLVRVLKLGHYSRSLGTINRVLRAKRHEITAAIFLVGILIIVASTLMYHIEHDVQPEAFRSIPKALWWGVATLTNGPSDNVVPATLAGRILQSVISILGIGVFALPSGIIVSGFVEEMQQDRKEVLYCARCHEEIAVRMQHHSHHHDQHG